MKDYTKYDFAAIVGAEVEITQNGGHKYSGTLKLVGRQNGAILLYPSDEKKPAYWFVIENIAPGSLTAKIKVEDMSVKQLEKAFSIDWSDAIIIDRTTNSLDIHNVDCGELGGCRIEKPLTDYIDCTDWGWKHE